ncbi:MAG: SHOCT domain-containing protein [Oscillospiraceae bacterium]|nr:SHOCT domain-containing protein [Oscillospiraceae bacterium]
MTEELFQRVALYHATMSLMRGMLTKGIISEKEYMEIDTIFAEKYGLSLSTIYR